MPKLDLNAIPQTNVPGHACKDGTTCEIRRLS